MLSCGNFSCHRFYIRGVSLQLKICTKWKLQKFSDTSEVGLVVPRWRIKIVFSHNFPKLHSTGPNLVSKFPAYNNGKSKFLYNSHFTDKANSAAMFCGFPAVMTLGNFFNMIFIFIFSRPHFPWCFFLISFLLLSG